MPRTFDLEEMCIRDRPDMIDVHFLKKIVIYTRFDIKQCGYIAHILPGYIAFACSSPPDTAYIAIKTFAPKHRNWEFYPGESRHEPALMV